MSNRSNSPEFFKAVFNSTPVGLVIIDEHGFFLEANGKFYNMFGYNTTELLNQPSHIIFPDSIQQDVQVIQQSVLNGSSVNNILLPAKTKQGSLINVNVNFDPFTDETGGRLIIAYFKDVFPKDQRIN